MTVSIITINRNNAAGLSRTLRSVAEQSNALSGAVQLEHIVVDGESTDNSLSKIQKYPLTKVVSQPPRGVYNAINCGLRLATGDVVGLLHSGDVFASENILKSISDIFASDTSYDYVWGDVTIGRRYYRGDSFNAKALQTGFAPPHPSLYVRRQVFETVGLYDESFLTAADFDYFVRLHRTSHLKGLYLDSVVVNMEPGGLSQTLRNRMVTNNIERLRSLRTNGMSASRLRLLGHYTKVFKQILCSSKKK